MGKTVVITVVIKRIQRGNNQRRRHTKFDCEKNLPDAKEYPEIF